MADSLFNRYDNFPQRHLTITPSDTVNIPNGMVVMAGTAGVLAVVDEANVVINYTVTAGTIIPIVAKRVNATGTTVTQVIGLL